MSLPDAEVRVVILTALDVEYKAVVAHLTDVTEAPHPAGTLFEVGRLRQSSCRVAVGLTGAGNTNAAVVAERAIATFHPQALFFVGIAGALHDDLALGDVIFGRKVYAYHGGRADNQGFHATPEAWFPPHALEQIAHQLDRTGMWRTSLPAAADPKLYFRPIAAGEVVLNSATHPLREQLDRHYADSAAIEMESAGAARAGQMNRSLPTLTIRGISDRADGNKYVTDAGGHQANAMVGAAAFAAALADRVPAGSTSTGAPSPAPKQQNIVSYGGLAAGAMDGNVYLHPGLPTAAVAEQPTDGPAWRPLPQTVDIVWRTDRSGHSGAIERSALELHLMPIGDAARVPVRRITALGVELAAAGRRSGLFTAGQELRIDSDDRAAWATAVRYADGPAGLVVDRLGQRSAWRPLPHDSLGAVLDDDDLVERLTGMLATLMALNVPDVGQYAPAVGAEPAMMLTVGRVRDLPRQNATMGLSSPPNVRLAADESISTRDLRRYPGEVSAELAARLLVALRSLRQ
ncbi:5'-methylthioadenosine/S-adenosylhomocysteine nucleosidase [Micromonospora narathiwatensis]|uniref:Nucleoside phosphorylase n=1 Tax=Micromonospora narathiwatensis TaxID=299146 RepID=A0A1A8ZAX9_9ACTN|nr:5'-methylthioadenosine/S-adenosylhomocysteine nucleosidase [Micromonospora narathiwatensis]SBT40992.1 Nucleoside phosphorylase [Micromonospora narathiwatensis]